MLHVRMPCVGATSGSYLFKPSSVDVLLHNIHYSLIVFGKNCSESQKLGFVRLQDDLPTLLRHFRRMGHLHDGSICCLDFGSFAKILTTHETAKRCLHTENERTIFCWNPMQMSYFFSIVYMYASKRKSSWNMLYCTSIKLLLVPVRSRNDGFML